jgi:hypothetical protein
MAVLQSTNVQGALCVNGVAVGGGKDFKFCCISSSISWTPTQDLVDGDGFIVTDMIGGGGGGGANYAVAEGFNRPGYSQKCCVCVVGNNTNPAAGMFINEKRNYITATTDCAITIGAGGNTGSYTFPADPNTGGAASSGSAVAGEAGGNTTGFGAIAYGGCGGGSKIGWSTQTDGGSIDCATVITCAGCYGGKPNWYSPNFATSDPYTPKSQLDLDSVRISSSLYLYRNDAASSGTGWAGVDASIACASTFNCGVFTAYSTQNGNVTNCSDDIVCEPADSINLSAITSSDDMRIGWGNAGANGWVIAKGWGAGQCSRVGQSGSLGVQGIVVLRWME